MQNAPGKVYELFNMLFIHMLKPELKLQTDTVGAMVFAQPPLWSLRNQDGDVEDNVNHKNEFTFYLRVS